MWRTPKGEWAKRIKWPLRVTEALLGYRNDCKRTQDYSAFAARSLSELAILTIKSCVSVDIAKAVAPSVVTLEKLDNLYASLNYTAPRKPYDMRAAEQRAFGSGRKYT